MNNSETHFRLRLPNDLHQQIKQDARENQRSMNGEIVYRLMKEKTAPNHTA